MSRSRTSPDHILIGMRRRHHQHDDDTALLLLRSLTEPDTPATTGKGSRVLIWTVQPGPNAVHHGRAQILAARHRWGLSQETVDDAQLVLSELITNALRHGTPPVHGQLRATTTSLYLEVADASHQRPRRRGATSTDENGRGLLLVNAYARRWGIRPQTTGKIVWAELELTPHIPPTQRASASDA